MKRLTIEQGSIEWLQLRKARITSTDLAAILNMSPWVNAVELWKEKVGLKEPPIATQAMKRGLAHEDDARKLAITEIGRHFEPVVIVSDDAPWLMASLDGISDSGYSFIEIKTPSEENWIKAQDAPIPRHYMIQMQTAIAASDGAFKEGYYCVYSPERRKLIIRHVKPDVELIERIIEESRIFQRRIREFDCPPGLHRVVESDDLRQAVDAYRLAKDMASRAEQMKQEAEERIKSIAGDDCIEGCGLKLTRYWRKGNVDYASIPALKDIDLDRYRKPASEHVRITIN